MSIIPTSEMFDIGPRVLSLPSLDIHDSFDQTNEPLEIVKKQHTSMDDVNMSVCDQHPISCMNTDNVILGSSTCCGYISSSHSSSSNSVSISDALRLVKQLTSVYANQNSQSLLDSDLITSGLTSAIPASLDDIIIRSVPSKTIDDVDLSEKSSPTPLRHKLSVPSKAAAILGAREVFIAPSHAAYRRLVDYTHRPTSDGQSLLNTDAPYLPTLAHPSLTARTQRKSKPDMNSLETSPEAKGTTTKGIDDVKEKLNFLRRPGELLSGTANSDSNAVKLTKTKYTEKLFICGEPSIKQIRKWSNSFEELLLDSYGLALFHEYLKSEYSEENIEFWIACEEYKAIANPKKMVARAHKIIKDFVDTQATKEINLDSKTRQLTMENIQRPSCNMFETAQKRIQTLMEIDSYQRFLRSAMYQSLLQEIANEETTRDNPSSPPASILMDTSLYSASDNTDVQDEDHSMSLSDLRSPGSRKQYSHSSIMRISSMKTTKSGDSSENVITPSNSDYYFKSTTR